METYEENKKGGRRLDIIKLLNLHLLYCYSYFFHDIFKVKFKLKFKKLFNY
jgi:hypothetical protein